VVVDEKVSMYKVMKTFVSRGCMNPVTGTGHTSIDTGVKANLELVDKLVIVFPFLCISVTGSYFA